MYSINFPHFAGVHCVFQFYIRKFIHLLIHLYTYQHFPSCTTTAIYPPIQISHHTPKHYCPTLLASSIHLSKFFITHQNSTAPSFHPWIYQAIHVHVFIVVFSGWGSGYTPADERSTHLHPKTPVWKEAGRPHAYLWRQQEHVSSTQRSWCESLE